MCINEKKVRYKENIVQNKDTFMKGIWIGIICGIIFGLVFVDNIVLTLCLGIFLGAPYGAGISSLIKGNE